MKFSPVLPLAAAAALVGAVLAGPIYADPTPADTAADAAALAAAKSPLDFTVNDIDGKPVDLTKYKGKVVMIVNTASKCGFTPQYADLESLYEKYKDKGFCILAFPANDFAHQEPGTDADIKTFCTGHYKTTFDIFSKVVVKGDGQAPLYTYLTSKTTDPDHSGSITWNFNKFLVDKKGSVINRWPSPVKPTSAQIDAAVQAALSE